MAFIIFITFIGILGITLTLFGKRLAAQLKSIDLRSVTGALLGLATVARYALFLLLAVPVMFVVHYIEWREPPNPSERWFQHVFSLEFENNTYQLNSDVIDDSGLTTITDITGSVHFGQIPGMTYVILFIIGAVWFYLAYQFLRHSELILRSLYERTPFVPGNDILAKKIAIYGLGISLTSYFGKTILGWYLLQSFTLEGVTLNPQGESLLRPLVIAGVLFVMSEVFRVGRELKEENELTV